HFWDVPEVVARTTRLATGDPDISVAEYLSGKYLRGHLRGLSLGCGTGGKEARWAATGCFSELACYDLSAARIERAPERQNHPAPRLEGADAYQPDFDRESFDAIIFEDSLHHFAPVKEILERCSRWLRPDGYLFVNEYTGPRKFQYPDRQIEAANALLAL